jgi:O-antigen ligase
VLLAALFAAIALRPERTLLLMVVFGLGLPALIVAWRFPDLGILGLVFLGSRILSTRLIEIRLPVGGGIELPDLALIALLGLSLLRQAQRNNLHLPASWVLPPLALWMWLALFSALWAIIELDVEVSWAMSELRGLAYFAVFVLVMWEITTRQRLKRLIFGLFVIGLLVIGLMLIQQFVGGVPLLAGQQDTTWQIIGTRQGITRIRPPAHVLLYFLSILSFVLAAFVRHLGARLLLFGVTIFMNLALLLTFTRSQWVASALAIVMCFFLLPGRARWSLIGLAGALAVGGMLIYATQRDTLFALTRERNFATPLVMRIESIFELDQTLDSYSAQTRYMQTGAALDSIQQHPWMGVGLGNAYRGLTQREAVTRYTRFTRFVENSYLYIPVKMGIPSLLIFGWMAVTVLWSGWRIFRRQSDPLLQGISLTCWVCFAGILVWAFNHPLLMLSEYTIMIALIIGLSEAVGRMHIGEPHASAV